jgi:hypothetical protein
MGERNREGGGASDKTGMKKQIYPSIKANLIRGAFYVLLVVAMCAIPFALAQSGGRGTTKQGVASKFATAPVAPGAAQATKLSGVHSKPPSQFKAASQFLPYDVRPNVFANSVFGAPSPTPTGTPATCSNYIFSTGTDTIVPGSTDTGNHTDDGDTFVALPFSFQLYDQTFNGVNVNSNGRLDFVCINEPGGYQTFCLPAPPNQCPYDYTIFPMWEDMRTDAQAGCASFPGGTCGVFTSVSGTAPNRIFNIEWRSVYFATPTATANFEVRLYENDPNKRFDVIYGVVQPGGGDSYVGGVQGPNGASTQDFCDVNPPPAGSASYTCTGGGASPTPTPSPSCTPIVVTGSIDTSDPTQTDRLFRSGIPQTCPPTTSCAIFGDGLPRHYDEYMFTNTTGATQCVSIDTNTACTGTNAILIGAYLSSFDPNNICSNWIGDSGRSPNPDQAFQVNVDNGQTLVVVVSEVTPDAGCPSYTVTITGFCGGGVSPTPTPTATPTCTVGGTPGPWMTASPYPTTIVRYGFAQTSTHLYVFGGVSDGNRVNAVNRMDLATGMWESRAPMPFTSEAPTCALMEDTGIVYCAEGDTGTHFSSYDTATDTWTSLVDTPNPTDDYGSASGAFNGKVFLVGGTTGFSNAVWVYDVVGNSWTAGRAVPNGTLLSGYQQVGQFLYVVGGWTNFGPNNLTTTYRLDMSSAPGTWETGPTFTPALADFGLAYDQGTNKLYSLGGDLPNDGNFFNSTNQVNELDLSGWPTGTWVSSPPDLPLPNRQSDQAGFFGNGDIWSVGGVDGGTLQFLSDVYHRTNGGGCATPSPTPTATATATPTATATETGRPTPTPRPGPTLRPRPTPAPRPTPTPTPPGAWTLGQWYQWTNGHYYSVQAITGPDNSWTIARTQARALIAPDGSACDLATVTSADENDFIFAGINDPTYWAIDGAGNNEGPNLGGFQYAKLAEPAGDWIWVTGELWSFTQWNPGEPNNSGGDEDVLTYFATGSARSSNWNDITFGDGSVIHYYVAESTGLTCAPPPAGLVSWWPADGNANDIQGSNNGTLQNNASIWPSLVDQGFSFTGGSDRVFIADSPSLAITASLTLDAWVNAASTPPNGIGDIIFRGDDRPFLDPYTLRMVGSNVSFQVSDAAGNIASVEAPLLLNQFVHVAGTLDDATGVMTLYLNGAVAAQTTTTVRPYGTLTGANPGVSIGNLQSDTTLEPFIGLIDEAQVFNRALGAAEVLGIYNAGNSGQCKLGTTVNVPATANIFGAGHATPPGGGTLPPVFNFQPGPNLVLTFSSVTGTIILNHGSGDNPNDPDGIGSASDENVSSISGISGIINEHAGFLTGVFVDDTEPMDPAPPVLDFSTIGTDFLSLSPALNQTFFIGDGLTGDGTGSVQQFNVPAGATRLFLGIADACGYHGSPGCYDDNLDSFTATFTVVQSESGRSSADRRCDTVTRRDVNQTRSQIGDPLDNTNFRVAGTLDDARGAMTLYLNGVAAAQPVSTVKPFGPMTGANPGVSIGNLQLDTTLEPFIGLIDEAQVYNRALDPSEVLALHNAGNPGQCKP